MTFKSGIAIAGLILAGSWLAASAVQAQDDCDHGGNHTIQVREGDNGQPVLQYRGGPADEVRVCLGDRVQWVLTGPNRDYFVDFFGAAPFAGALRRGSSQGVVSVVIGGPAERGAGYEYGVEFADGEGMDPRIVVD